MTIVFEDAEYVPTGAGRPAEPNEFTEVISQIALKVDGNGKPLAKSFVAEHGREEDDRKKEVERIKRRLSAAGEQNDPKVSVFAVAEPVVNPVNKTPSATKTRITFWTIAKVRRQRKVNVESPANEGDTQVV